ncbi:hypothetical protein ABZ892_31950 [Streptomyces sp. NPDC046924]|uniref:hypothetical protein n=1 Tax=Streptomyces sp. NPDC046924 TaxID=3155136 RepID=UPI0034022260
MQVHREPAGVNGVPAAELVAPVLEAELAAVFTGECRQYHKETRGVRPAEPSGEQLLR